MLKKLLLLFILLPLFATGKDFQVRLAIKNLPEGNVPVLLRIYNGNMIMLDSIPAKNGEILTFDIPDNIPRGMLKVVLGPSAYAKYTNGQPTAVDFLFNREDIEFSLDFNNPEKTLKIIRSEENKVYFEALRHEILFFRKLALLEQVVLQYPEQDDFYHSALKYYQKYQTDREKLLDSMYAARPHMLATKILNTRRLPFTAGNLSPTDRDSIYQHHFLDKLEFNDTTLLYTNAYTDKLYQYIQFFIKPNQSPRENEAAIIKALDNIMPKLESNEIVRTHLLQFLIQGFESMKMEEVLAHISENYLQQCNSSMEIVKRRLEKYQKMAIGQKVPDFTAVDVHNNPVSLYADIHPYTLLIFWHTNCSFCRQFLTDLAKPEIQQMLQHYDINIIGISIDDNREDWISYSAGHKLNFSNTFIEGGFYSETAGEYNLFATPSLFLLDNNHTILAKPLTIEELVNALKKL